MKLAGMTQNPHTHTLMYFHVHCFHVLSCTRQVTRCQLGYPVVSQMTQNVWFSVRLNEVLCPFTVMGIMTSS